MKLSDDGLVELYENFPLLRDILYSRSNLGQAQFYALASLRTHDINSKVQEALEWISSQVRFVPAQDIDLGQVLSGSDC